MGSIWSHDPKTRSWKAHFAGVSFSAASGSASVGSVQGSSAYIPAADGGTSLAASGSGSSAAAVPATISGSVSSAATVPAGLSTLPTLEPGKAYWIKASRAVTLTPAAAPSGKALYYHPDHLGSTAFTTDADGNVLSETHYYPFGLPRLRTGADPNGAEYLHTDHELDSESGLIYSNARYRDPVVGRFVSVDPFFVEAGSLSKEFNKRFLTNPQEGNLLSYAGNNPINRIDPLGLWDSRVHFGSDEFGGTVKWAQDMGFSEAEAKRIGSANTAVDYVSGDMDPFPIPFTKYDQGYHFDVNRGKGLDSRMERAGKHLRNAVEYKRSGNLHSALSELGKGLHAIQDRYSHTKEMTTYEANKGLYHHYGSNGDGFLSFLTGDSPKVDNPDFKPERLAQTEKATKAYLHRFFSATE